MISLPQINVITFTASQMILLSLLPYLAEKSHLELAQVVLSFSVGSFLFLFSSPFWGRMSDKWSREIVIALGLAGLFVSNLCLSFLVEGEHSLVLLWLGRFVYGLSASAIVPVTQALLLDQSPDEAPFKPLLKNSIALNTGRAIGPAYLMGVSMFNMDTALDTALWGLTALCGLLVAVNIFKKKSPTPHRHPVKDSSFWASFGKLQWIGVALGFLFATFIGILNTGLAQLLVERLSLASDSAGFLMAKILFASAVLAVMIQILIRRFIQTPWNGLMLSGSLALLLGAVSLLKIHHENQLPLLVLFLSWGLCVLPPCYMSLITEERSQVGFKTSLIAMLNTLGYATGGALLSLVLWLQIRIDLLVLTLSLLLLASVLLAHYLRSREPAYDVL